MEEEIREIVTWLNHFGINKYDINWGVVDVMESVRIDDPKITKIPIKFGTIIGDFICSQNPGLTDLENAPRTVTGFFDCAECSLTSLEGAPETVGSYFACEKNNLTTLDFMPDKVGGMVYIRNNSFIIDDSFYRTLVGLTAKEYPLYQSIEMVGGMLSESMREGFLGWILNENRKKTLNEIIND